MPIKILIGADVCPTKSNYEQFAKADTNALIGPELVSLLQSADYTIFNLETPLTDTLTPIPKSGPNLAAPTVTVNGLKAINPHFFTLANNHILDQGVQGLQCTEKLLREANISYAGVGENLTQAGKPYVTTIKGVKLGIYCCAEHEFSIATDNTSGANPYDPLTSFDAVRELVKQCDFVLVLYHGGKEHYRYPSPQVQRIFHKFADCGAGLIIAQHTHCIGCMEEYKDSILIYGQGNFLFDDSDKEYWLTSLLIELTIQEDSKDFSVAYIPCVKKGNRVRLADNDQASQILKDFNARSADIKRPNYIRDQYAQFAAKQLNGYLYHNTGCLENNLLTRILNKLIGPHWISWLYTKKDLRRIRNIIECEAHRELFLQGLKRNKRGKNGK